jgi:hypothetical protein
MSGRFVRHDADMPNTDVTISLTGDEALILFDLLHRWEDDERVTEPENAAEQVALGALSALLERELPEPFDPRYSDLVSEARARLKPSE